MRDTRLPALLAGVPLLFLLRWAERGQVGLLASALLEEGAKAGMFLALALVLRWGRGRAARLPDPELLPLLAVVGFALAENLLYLLHSPTTAVYRRLLYSYPIHLNTGLLYAAVFTLCAAGRSRGRAPGALAVAAALAALPAGTAYHFLLNALALVVSGPAVYAVGAANILLMALLFAGLQRLRLERSLDHAGV